MNKYSEEEEGESGEEEQSGDEEDEGMEYGDEEDDDEEYRYNNEEYLETGEMPKIIYAKAKEYTQEGTHLEQLSSASNFNPASK